MKVLATAALVAACSYPEPIDVCVGECQLLAIYPSTVSGNIQIDVHGSFENDSALMFPGGVSTELDGPISHRVHNLEVPFQTTAGLVTLTSRGPSHGSVPLRRATFELGLSSFGPAFDQASGGRGLSSLPRRKGSAAVVIGHYIYVIGGVRDTAPTQTVEQMLLGADGSLGDARDYPETLQHTRSYPTATVIGKHLYVTGGLVASGRADNTVERAEISDDGQLGPFEIVDIELHTARGAHASAVIGNYLWLFGGNDGSSALGTIERAPIYNAAELGSFEPVTGLTMMPRYGHTVTVAGDRVILAGGTNGTSPQPIVEVFEIEMNGFVNDSRAIRLMLAVPRAYHAAVSVGLRLYLIGGTDTDSVEVADLTQPSLTFKTVADLQLGAVRSDHAALVAGNFVYVLGGASSTGTLAVERASIMETSNLFGFHQVPPRLKNARSHHAAAVIGNYVYVFGGQQGGARLLSIERAEIQPDGTLGDFAIQLATLASARDGHTVTVYGGYVYLIGGANGSVQTQVSRAPINPDGTLGMFEAHGSLFTGRAYHASVVVGNTLYVLGGMVNGGAPTASCERATFSSNGLGSFTEISSCMLQPRMGHSAAVLGNNVYVFSGSSGGTLAGIEIGAIGVNDSVTFAFANTSLQVSRVNHTVAVAGKRLYVIDGTDNGGSPAPLEVTSIQPGGLISSFNTPTGNPSPGRPRVGGSAFVIGNNVYVIGGRNGTGTDTDIVEVSELR